MKLGFKIAGRFLKSNLGQTILIVLGIAIGVSVQIFIGCLIQGLQKSLIEKTIGHSPQITITSETDNKRIPGYENLLNKIQAADSRVSKVSVADDNPAFLVCGSNSQSILVRGFNIKKANNIYDFINRLKEGTYPKNQNEIILGVDLKKEYGLALNDVVTIMTNAQKVQECRVVGFFDLNVANLNKTWAITTLETTNTLFGTSGTVSSIEVQVAADQTFAADQIATSIADKLDNQNLTVANWKAQNAELLSGLQGQSISSIMIQVFVMISVVLGIASVLAITVLQKSKQIGILKAMGIRNTTTGYIFLSQGLILGVLGAVLGIAFGLGLSFLFTKFALNPDGTPVVALYISYPFIALSGAIAVAASVVAAMIPAVKSSKLNPIDIIRNN
jgi:lipoprotein-releasing system permease protein